MVLYRFAADNALPETKDEKTIDSTLARNIKQKCTGV